MIRPLFVLIFLSLAAPAQVTTVSPAVTVTSSLGQNVTPDQVSFQITLQSGLNVSLDDVTAALKNSGLSTTNLTNVATAQIYNSNGSPSMLVLQWTFQVLVPLANVKSEVASLQALSAALAKGQVPLTLSYTMNGPQVSNQAAVQSCSLSDLFAAVQTKAKQMAGAANRSIGSLSALSSSVSTQIGPAAGQPYIVPSCTLTATFGTAPANAAGITVYATRTVNVPPDQAVVGAAVVAPADASIDDALAALPGTGFAASNLYNIYSSPQIYGATATWLFSMAVPFAKLGATLAALQKLPPSTVSFSIQGTQVSPQLLASQDCSYQSLLNDAQAQARQVTAEAGVQLNDLISVSDTNAPIAVRNGYVQGDFSQIISGAVFVAYIPSIYNAPPTCSLSARYGIGQ